MTADAPTPIDPNFRIELPNFEGPLDLLLHLIKKHELDILDLPVAFVAGKYADYLDLMKSLNLDVASEYLVMAATLTYIKSRELLPRSPYEEEEEEEDLIDPRAELIRRLLEYQKYKRAGDQLGGRAVVGRDIFTRGSPSPKAKGPAPLAAHDLFKLLDAFQAVVKRHDGDLGFEISAERISIQERMAQVTSMMRDRKRVRFDQLFENVVSTYDLVVTFLALLEMAKMRIVRVYQAEPDAPIHLEYRADDALMEALSGDGLAVMDAEQAEAAFGQTPHEAALAEANAVSGGVAPASDPSATHVPSSAADPAADEVPTSTDAAPDAGADARSGSAGDDAGPASADAGAGASSSGSSPGDGLPGSDDDGLADSSPVSEAVREPTSPDAADDAEDETARADAPAPAVSADEDVGADEDGPARGDAPRSEHDDDTAPHVAQERDASRSDESEE